MVDGRWTVGFGDGRWTRMKKKEKKEEDEVVEEVEDEVAVFV